MATGTGEIKYKKVSQVLAVLREIAANRRGWDDETERVTAEILGYLHQGSVDLDEIERIIELLEPLAEREVEEIETESEVEMKSVALNSEQLKQLLAELDDAEARANPDGEAARLAKKHGWAEESVKAAIAQKTKEQQRLKEVLEARGLEPREAERLADQASDLQVVMGRRLAEAEVDTVLVEEVVSEVLNKEILPKIYETRVIRPPAKVASEVESLIREAGIPPKLIEAVEEIVTKTIVMAEVGEMANDQAKLLIEGLEIEDLPIEAISPLTKKVRGLLLEKIENGEMDLDSKIVEVVIKEIAASKGKLPDGTRVSMAVKNAEVGLRKQLEKSPETRQVYLLAATEERITQELLTGVKNPDRQTVAVAREVARIAAGVYHHPAAEEVVAAYPAAVTAYHKLDAKIYPPLAENEIRQRGEELRIMTGWMGSEPRSALQKIKNLQDGIRFLQERGIKVPGVVGRIAKIGNLFAEAPNGARILAGGNKVVRLFEGFAKVEKFMGKFDAVLGKVGLDKLAGKIGLKIAEKFGFEFLKNVGAQGAATALAGVIGVSVPVAGWIIAAAVLVVGAVKGFVEKIINQAKGNFSKLLKAVGLPDIGGDVKRWIENNFGDGVIGKTIGMVAEGLVGIFTLIGLIAVPTTIVIAAIFVVAFWPALNMIANVSPYISGLVSTKGAYPASQGTTPIGIGGSLPEGCPRGWPSIRAPITQGPSCVMFPGPICGIFTHLLANAVDLSLVTGTEIRATHKGRAVALGSPFSFPFGSYVEVYSTCQGKDYKTRYAHLMTTTFSGVKDVAEGELVGLSDNTGFSTGPHLHYEISPAQALGYSILDTMGL